MSPSAASFSASVRPPGLHYRRMREHARVAHSASLLHCDDLPLSAVAEKFGTPLYVYSATTIRQRYHHFDRAFRQVPHTICYSVKANSNLALLRFLCKLGCGFDVVSGGELQRVLRV